MGKKNEEKKSEEDKLITTERKSLHLKDLNKDHNETKRKTQKEKKQSTMRGDKTFTKVVTNIPKTKTVTQSNC